MYWRHNRTRILQATEFAIPCSVKRRVIYGETVHAECSMTIWCWLTKKTTFLAENSSDNLRMLYQIFFSFFLRVELLLYFVLIFAHFVSSDQGYVRKLLKNIFLYSGKGCTCQHTNLLCFQLMPIWCPFMRVKYVENFNWMRFWYLIVLFFLNLFVLDRNR